MGIKHTITQTNVNEQGISITKKRSYTNMSGRQYTLVRYVREKELRKMSG